MIGPPDAAGLRRAGLSHLELLHVVLGCAHFNYFNRVADGIGIALDYPQTLPAGGPARPALCEDPADGERPEGAAGDRTPSAARWRGMDDVFAAMSLNPEAEELARKWRAHHLRGTERLGRAARLEIGASIASLCGSRLLRRAYADELEGLAPGGVTGPADSTLLEHAWRLTRLPWTINETHVEDLRRTGLDDRGLLELTTLAAYFNCECRTAIGLDACFA